MPQFTTARSREVPEHSWVEVIRYGNDATGTYVRRSAADPIPFERLYVDVAVCVNCGYVVESYWYAATSRLFLTLEDYLLGRVMATVSMEDRSPLNCYGARCDLREKLEAMRRRDEDSDIDQADQESPAAGK
jgi:hypothetical protein